MARGTAWILLKMSNWYAKVWWNSAEATQGLKNNTQKIKEDGGLSKLSLGLIINREMFIFNFETLEMLK